MKNRSIFVLVVTVFFVGFLGMTTIQHFFYAEDSYVRQNQKRMKRLAAQMKIAYALLEDGRPELVGERFDVAYGSTDIDFFILERNGEVLSSAGDPPAVDFQINEIVFSNAYGYIKTGIDGYTITAGVTFDFDEYHYRAFERYKEYIIRDALLIGFILLGVMMYFLRDMRNLVRALRSGDISQLEKIHVRTNEADILKKSLASFEGQVQEAANENKVLKDQILPALKSELFSGLKPPYDFKCVLVRTDINHFSSILKQHNKGEFFETINEFFTICTRIISRYDGVVSEFLGDEIIYYFKDQENYDSAILALAALKDIEAVTYEFHEKMMSERGYPFLVKSSVGSGELNFGKQVDRYTLSGTPLIDTVRILSQISSREKNVAWVSPEIAQRCEDYAEFESVGEFDLKGVAKMELFEVRKFLALDEVIEATGNLKDIGYYRSDRDYQDLVKTHLMPGDVEANEDVIGHIRSNPPFGGSEAVRNLWFAAIRTHAADDSDSRVLSALVSTAAVLVNDELRPDERLLVRELLSHSDTRVVANAIDFLVSVQDSESHQWVNEHLDHINHRVRVAAIVLDLVSSWNSASVRRLEKMLRSNKDLVRASGLWGVKQVRDHYLSKNPLFVSSNGDMESLISLSERIEQAEDLGVKKTS